MNYIFTYSQKSMVINRKIIFSKLSFKFNVGLSLNYSKLNFSVIPVS